MIHPSLPAFSLRAPAQNLVDRFSVRASGVDLSSGMSFGNKEAHRGCPSAAGSSHPAQRHPAGGAPCLLERTLQLSHLLLPPDCGSRGGGAPACGASCQSAAAAAMLLPGARCPCLPVDSAGLPFFSISQRPLCACPPPCPCPAALIFLGFAGSVLLYLGLMRWAPCARHNPRVSNAGAGAGNGASGANVGSINADNGVLGSSPASPGVAEGGSTGRGEPRGATAAGCTALLASTTCAAQCKQYKQCTGGPRSLQASIEAPQAFQ